MIKMDEKTFQIMVNEYRNACSEYYEAKFGEKTNIKYTIENRNTGEIIYGDKSGCGDSKEAREVMRSVRRMMIAIFGEQVKETLEEIRKEERKKEKSFFEENPQFVVYVTSIE